MRLGDGHTGRRLQKSELATDESDFFRCLSPTGHDPHDEERNEEDDARYFVRRAWLTDSEFGKASDTSGSRTITLELWRKRS
jgi:hypothetical protein